MTPSDKQELRKLRDDTIDEQDKKLLRRTISHIATLEAKLHSIRTLARAINNETQIVVKADPNMLGGEDE